MKESKEDYIKSVGSEERGGRRKKRKWEGREEEGSPYPRTGPFFQGGAYKPWVSHRPGRVAVDGAG